MLYERWLAVAQEGGSELALHDLAADRRWTFAQLQEVCESAPSLPGVPLALPTGANVEFVLCVLRAWRAGRIVCPLEPGQAPPSDLAGLPTNCVHLKTTSATTGAPRCIAFTASQLIADAANIVSTMGLRPDWPNLGVISLGHSYGFSNLVLPLLLHGIPLILGDSPLPETVRRAATTAPFITLPGVPALWRAWVDAQAIPHNVKLAISAGAPLSEKLESQIFSRSGIKVHNFYGSSECGGIAYDRTETPRSDAACVGTPLENVQLSIADDGCIAVRGPAVGLTYWPQPEGRLRDGCFHTSDLAEISNGQVFLRGRASDQINVAGRKIAPELIERVLASHPSVADCLVFGVPSEGPERGEKVVACVVTRSSVSESELKTFVSERSPSWQAPREWWFVSSLQTNERGKLSRAEWRERFLARQRCDSRTASD